MNLIESVCCDGPAPGPSRLRALVVETDAHWRSICAGMLARAGFSVSEAEDDAQGWDVLCAVAFDVVVIDWALAKTSSLALVRRMRAAKMKQPVVLMSAETPPKSWSRNPFHGVDTFIAKPFSHYELLTRLDRVLELGSRHPFRPAALAAAPHPS